MRGLRPGCVRGTVIVTRPQGVHLAFFSAFVTQPQREPAASGTRCGPHPGNRMGAARLNRREAYTPSFGWYWPQTSRSALQTSPIVADSFSASRIG